MARAAWVAGLALCLLAGCGPYRILLRPTLDPDVTRAINRNTTETVSFTFSSRQLDGPVIPYRRNKEELYPEDRAYAHTVIATVRQVVNDFMGEKFARLSPPPCKTTIRMVLDEFYIEEYAVDSYGNPAPKTPLPEAPLIEVVAVINVTLTVAITGEFTVTKRLVGEAKDRFGRPVASDAGPDALYLGPDALQTRHSRNADTAVTDLLRSLNDYLGEIGF